jgi:hypothetical protein
MDDLVTLNRRIADHWLGSLDADQEEYLSYAPVCLAQFTHGAAELAETATREKLAQHNPLPVAKLNRQYLRFARLAAKDVAAGKPDMIVKLGITLAQAEVLGSLTNKAVNRLAFGWNGPIIHFEADAFIRGAALNVRVAKQHAMAFVATRLTTENREHP